MKIIVIATAVMLSSISSANGQTVQIDGKTFQTVKRKVLNSEIEYYKLKEKGKRSQTPQSYIKLNDSLIKTVFNNVELENFLSTGKISALGTIKEKRVNEKQKITYVIKSDILVLIRMNKSSVSFLEIYDTELKNRYLGETVIVKSDDNPSGGSGSSDPGRDCRLDCLYDYVGNEDENNAGCLPETIDDARECERVFEECKSKCPPARKGSGSMLINTYTISMLTFKKSD